MMPGSPRMVEINVIYTDEHLQQDLGGVQYARVGDAGADLRACFDLDHEKAYKRVEGDGWGPVRMTIKPNETVMVSAGFAMEVPLGFQANIHPRGGRGTKGLVIGNLTGVIDAGYQGEVFICLWNRTDEPLEIEAYERVAQMVINPVYTASFNPVGSFEHKSERGDGKLGSSGSM